MKKAVRNIILLMFAVFAAIGFMLCALGFSHGGSILRAMQNISIEPYVEINTNILPRGNTQRPRPGDSRGGNADSGFYDDDLSEFFKQFGMDDDDIEQFTVPFGGSGSDKSGSQSDGKIY